MPNVVYQYPSQWFNGLLLVKGCKCKYCQGGYAKPPNPKVSNVGGCKCLPCTLYSYNWHIAQGNKHAAYAAASWAAQSTPSIRQQFKGITPAQWALFKPMHGNQITIQLYYDLLQFAVDYL